ncbi:phosphatidylserine decarboxylase-domain-containing protein [Hysterangium stoloniferum]|nr:phosphatidylserine decarboxylase-domain-containing protein [Hysterangium stoloniferum]
MLLDMIVRSWKRGPGTRAYSSDSGIPPGKSLYHRLVHTWRTTPTKWYPLPISAGIALLVFIQFRKRHASKQYPEADSTEVYVSPGGDAIRLNGPLHIHVIGALPLRTMSRLWGYLNSLHLPVWFRPFGFKLYAFIFGCNLNEIDPSDLKSYKSLGEFFYRRLAPGVRPIEDAVLVSPADGKVLHFGTIKDLKRVEQVKGITYSLDALLGSPQSSPLTTPVNPSSSVGVCVDGHTNADHSVVIDSQFANVNGIEYSLGQLIGGVSPQQEQNRTTSKREEPETDASVPPTVLGDSLSRDAEVALSMGLSSLPLGLTSSSQGGVPGLRHGNSLFFAVIYLAPGDYHRFHSPAAWVVERRRHFIGELFSVSPYMAKRLQNLFVLNERVALLGRWTYGFFGMVPVGATNVGSIKINFDAALRTNMRPDKSLKRPPPGSYSEASYISASPLLGGQALKPGEEMGGFCLGSTIVLVFEAPRRFEFVVQEGEKIKVGQILGDVKKN